jgi:hypothetical protein
MLNYATGNVYVDSISERTTGRPVGGLCWKVQRAAVAVTLSGIVPKGKRWSRCRDMNQSPSFA